ncbi:MAG: DUF58 domain-containing protein [Candidatus Marinimicrobia bacterium]|nr:DUF58 domain-containing protein [Candidatus Neomarinimicrobiota bacterium]
MNTDKRKYLNPQTLATLANMQLRARMVVEGFIVGLHKSPYHGFSVEFAEHRAYGPGDNLRYLDWRLYGKTDRFYVKQFEEETNLKAHLMLDMSKSMAYGSADITKLQYGSYLSAALTYLLLRQQDAVGLTLFDTEIRTHIRPSSRPSMLTNILSHLERVEPGEETAIGHSLHHLADRIHRRGLVIIISDMLDDLDNILNGLKHFRHDRHEVLVFHILDPREVDFAFHAQAKFKDMESGEIMATEPWHIQRDYQNAVKQFRSNLGASCREQRVDYVPLTTDQSLDVALLAYLNKRHSVR